MFLLKKCQARVRSELPSGRQSRLPCLSSCCPRPPPPPRPVLSTHKASVLEALRSDASTHGRLRRTQKAENGTNGPKKMCPLRPSSLLEARKPRAPRRPLGARGKRPANHQIRPRVNESKTRRLVWSYSTPGSRTCHEFDFARKRTL